ncbi:winged helix-turn-helix transcriptional regulator (plasmid) [Halorussus salilacus]|uniref:AsnC family transcriptional regulator n=1 Tax=Halorussus salilacus TaxID=2953750 RepID=UPI00209DDD32|nr:AsnC family transcriptional regulator [Halorussus salilacus]USZ69709.1 winged helix-turn-helix transcriptional regulator [Halorussus salilacus]
MRELDETDFEILQLLVADARRPYNEIADAVGLSPPTVSDRIDRLQDLGVIRRFTLDLDRSLLSEGVAVLVDVRAEPGRVADVLAGVEELDGVEHVFVTADGHVVFHARLQEASVEALVAESLDAEAVREYDVRLLADSSWNSQPRGVELALECDECGNTVTAEGETARIDGDRYHFCCSSCKSRFEEKYEELREAA